MYSWLFVCLMVLNITFNNISAISWRSVSLVEEIGRPKKTLLGIHCVILETLSIHCVILEILSMHCGMIM